jgi:hypothetical protein
VKAAIDSGDYSAYQQAVANQAMSQDQFNAVVAHNKAEAPIRDAMQKAHQAVKDNDYAAWKDAMTEVYQLQTQQLTQENFDAIVKMGDQMGPRHGLRGWHGDWQNNATNS